jgi:hypothetical protein
MVPLRSVSLTPRLVRGWLAAYALAVVGAWLIADYVGAHVLSVVVPGVYGAFLGAVAVRVAGRAGPALAGPVLLGSAASALLAFRVFGEPLGATGRWLPPLLAALLGAVLGMAVASDPHREP